MIKPKLWKGDSLKGKWDFTLKIDGVRMLRDEDGNPVSRSGKPLYNLQEIDHSITDAEVYLKDWETSVSLVRTKDSEPISEFMVYSLDPLDESLELCTAIDPTAEFIKRVLSNVVKDGYEGLVLRQGDKWLKVKPKETYDVKVTGYQPGTGKHEGRMGALITSMGRVGTGFTDKQREEFTDLLGATIEVECMSLTPAGKFRHPRFIRVRWDK